MASLRTGVPLIVDRLSTVVRVDSAIPTVRSELRSVCPHPEHNTDPDLLKLRYICEHCGPLADKPAKARKVDGGWQVAEATAVTEARNAAAEPFKKRMTVAVHAAGPVTEAMTESGKAYWLAPDGLPEAYAIISDTVSRHPELAFLTQFAVRSAVTTYRLTVRDGALMISEYIPRIGTRPAPKVPDAPDDRWRTAVDMAILPLLETPFSMEALMLPNAEDAAFGGPVTPAPSAPASAAPDALLALLEAEVKKGQRKTARSTRSRKATITV